MGGAVQRLPCCGRRGPTFGQPFIVTAIYHAYGELPMECIGCGANVPPQPDVFGVNGDPRRATMLSLVKRIDDPGEEQSTEEREENRKPA